MKKILLTVMVMAFAVAVQADDAKCCPLKDKDKPACCPSKVKTSVQAKEGVCPVGKAACCSKKTAAKANAAKQTALVSPKATDSAK
ncbi:MAG TPA: hypothetical protein P5205_08910 [Candidatus Paceibacterota bacterium]|nr:hypothetical protein [Verrucomicrobiota bacterium]HSA10476.1 hypothetical protein [Candidatus Paceibacterota bacterium]